jgi:hypothetical protein
MVYGVAAKMLCNRTVPHTCYKRRHLNQECRYSTLLNRLTLLYNMHILQTITNDKFSSALAVLTCVSSPGYEVDSCISTSEW